MLKVLRDFAPVTILSLIILVLCSKFDEDVRGVEACDGVNTYSIFRGIGTISNCPEKSYDLKKGETYVHSNPNGGVGTGRIYRRSSTPDSYGTRLFS